jgi:toxin ParE1/3/4
VTAATLSRRARRDVDSAMEWIARDNPVAAQGLLDTVLKAAERIGQYPQIGGRRPDLTGSARYRFVILTGFPYLIVYAENHDPPLIVRIIHGARDLPRLLRDLPSQ